MSKQLTPQALTLLEHLKVKGSITQSEASTMYRMRALPRRISDLKEHGHNIRRELKADLTGQRYARYFYIKPLAVGSTIEITNPGITCGNYSKGDKLVVTEIDGDGDPWFVCPNGARYFAAPEEFKVVA